MCRKSHGTAFATYVSAAADGFELTSAMGEASIVHYASSQHAGRSFCRSCGAMVVDTPEHVPALLDRVSMPAGSLAAEGGLGIRPQAHIFVGSKAPWYTICDALPQLEAFPPGRAPIAEPNAQPARVARSAKDASGVDWVAGACLCGAVAFEMACGAWTLMQCHCSRCRSARAAAHGTNLFVPHNQLRWLRGRELRRAYSPPEAPRFVQTFCPTCGSKLPSDAPEWYVVPAGVLDGDPGIGERKHIFTGSKADWFPILDTHPQYEALPTQ